MKKILITGGCGYIGSHTIIVLLEAGYEIIVLDNLLNSYKIVIDRIKLITGKSIIFIKGDVRDQNCLNSIFSKFTIDAVFHFAGLKAVKDSAKNPLDYFDVNVNGTIQLMSIMKKFRVKKLVFSSSATVYGEKALVPYFENYGRGSTTNPYSTSKAFVEKILEDQVIADSTWSISILRYFNPIGAHKSGLIGENPKGTPNNLLPYLSQVAIGHKDKLDIFGNDYSTPDGTCRRDYIHVMDLAIGHVKALQYTKNSNFEIFNLGSEKPVSVLEIVSSFEKISHIKIPYRFVDRRDGDIAEFWANSSKALKKINWKANKTLDEMINDTWNWLCKNPNGYSK